MSENKIRLRIRKPFYYKKMDKRLMPDEVVTIPESEARIWLGQGMAVEDKSLDKAPEVKIEVDESGPKKSSRRRKS